jgi:hypothetical protein
MKKKQFEQIAAWQKETFGQATAISKLNHLKKEVDELIIDIAIDSTEKRLEFADCFFLLFGAAAADGMTYEDICHAIEEKFEINKARKWGKPDENGVVEHVRTDQTPATVSSLIEEVKRGHNRVVRLDKYAHVYLHGNVEKVKFGHDQGQGYFMILPFNDIE